MPDRPVVVGGGIAGLVVAWELARAGRRPILFEAEPEVGGVVRGHTVGGLRLDAGAESFAVTRPAVGALVDELGLADEVVRPEPTGAWVRWAGGTAPLPVGGLLGVPGRPWAADVRRVVGVTGAVRACADLVLPRRVGRQGSGLGGLVRGRMGGRVVQRLVEPVAGGVYAADPDALEVATVTPALARPDVRSLALTIRKSAGSRPRPGSAVASLRGGMHRLSETLATAVRAAGGEITVGTVVRSVTHAVGTWTVTTDSGRVLRTDTLVLAVPGAVARDLLGPAAPADLSTTVATPPTPVRLVTLVLDDPQLDRAPRGTGVLVARSVTDVAAKAITHATVKWDWLARAVGPGRHVVRLSYGRDDDSGGRPADDDALIEVARLDTGTLLGLDLDARSLRASAVVGWPAALPVPRPGHQAAVRDLRAQLRSIGVLLVGGPAAGTGLGAVVADARAQARTLLDPAAAAGRHDRPTNVTDARDEGPAGRTPAAGRMNT
ncbi:protoporphyrinogen oxidase [Nakamurella flava]|uniref:Coproporphyrinogen III oxidase n=1 Tax=Nakamurella flava TaxID=2576308 RepID=A0A4U6QPT8_9ACTN|nr:protoporphyrinogen oxidase [Nakamurella flava]